jgi:hypothetical protein
VYLLISRWFCAGAVVAKFILSNHILMTLFFLRIRIFFGIKNIKQKNFMCVEESMCEKNDTRMSDDESLKEGDDFLKQERI